jgi:N6-L-threonylcarbamoyladenine synthase
VYNVIFNAFCEVTHYREIAFKFPLCYNLLRQKPALFRGIMVYVLGIESTCDETACSIVRDGHEILSNVVSSQIDLHKEYGGVVPELACRRHIDVIIPVIKQALADAELELEDIDLISVAKGPGLIGALLIGLNTAKALALALKKPFVGVNHVEAHLYATIMTYRQEISFPALGVVVSGGHTNLIHIKDIGHYSLISGTVDDSIGEAFDKVASILGLPYPGGPEVEALALTGDPQYFKLKAGHVKGKPLDFSFSGLKTKVLYAAKGQSSNKHSPLIITEDEKKHLAASFQECALKDISNKSALAIKEYPCKSIILGGGVCNNQRLLEIFKERLSEIPVFAPPKGLTMDNAAMIAGLGFHYHQTGTEGDPLDLEASSRSFFHGSSKDAV